MVKNVLISVAIFLIVFIISLLAFMPIDKITIYYIDKALVDNKVNVKYKDIQLNLFGAKVSGVEYKDFKIDTLKLSYNPIGLIFSRVDFVADSPLFIANGKARGGDLAIDAKISVASVAKMLKYSGTGSLDVKVNYDYKKAIGDVKITGGPVTFAHTLMEVEFDSIQGDATIKGNSVTINKLATTGKTILDSAGIININPKRVDYSTMDIKGNVALGAMKLNFTLAGTFAAPQFASKM